MGACHFLLAKAVPKPAQIQGLEKHILLYNGFYLSQLLEKSVNSHWKDADRIMAIFFNIT